MWVKELGAWVVVRGNSWGVSGCFGLLTFSALFDLSRFFFGGRSLYGSGFVLWRSFLQYVVYEEGRENAFMSFFLRDNLQYNIFMFFFSREKGIVKIKLRLEISAKKKI